MDQKEFDAGYRAAIEALKQQMNSGQQGPQSPNNGNGGDDNNQEPPQGGNGGTGKQSTPKGKDNEGNPAGKPELNDEDKKKAEENAKDKSGGSGKGGDSKDIDREEGREEASRHAADVLKKYKDKFTGTLGKFTDKCRRAKKLEKPNAAANSDDGNGNWKQTLLMKAKIFIRQRLKSMKKYKQSYQRVKRGIKPYSSEQLHSGKAIIMPGKLEVRQKIGFDIALYIDTSGSMDHCINQVFKAAYSICDALKIEGARDQNVDKNKINLRTFIFTQTMEEIKYGTTRRATGGTYSFEDLLSDVNENGAHAFVNIVITDGEFGGVNAQKVAEVINGMDGMFFLVTNNTKGKFDNVEDEVKHVCGSNKLVVLYTDSEFTVK